MALFVSVAAIGGLAQAETTTTESAPAVGGLSAADYTADSWAAYTAVRRDAGAATTAGTHVKSATDALVMVRGLKDMVADYRTRVVDRYTPASRAPFVKALDVAADVAADPSATESEVAAAKTALVTAAGNLVAADEGTFQTITNDTFWNDTAGNPIYSQGGGVFRFGDTYYWYGVHYRGAESYRQNPTRKYDNEVSFVAIPVYSSKDLVNWTFERNIATTSTRLGSLGTMGQSGWVGRLGVAYNENTGKYVLLVQLYTPSIGGEGHAVLFLQGDSPTDTFDYAHHQVQVTNSPTTGTGDQTIFTDDDGQDYLIFSNRSGRSRAFVAKLRASDSLRVEPAVEIGRTSSGREGNAMFKLDGKYYNATSDLHGWNTSVTHILESTTGNIQGAYTSEYTLPGTEMDYSHVTQTGFFVTVNGTKKKTVIYAGDRWADFAWNGIGYNQWMPVDKATAGARPQFHSLSQWQFNATTGEWRVGPRNNYILNPDFQADRITVSSLTGWTNVTESGPSSLVSNVNGGANGSRFGLQVGASQSFAGGARQRITVPAGTYRLSTFARTTGSLSNAQVTVTDAAGASRTLTIPGSGNWTRRELSGFTLAAGTATVTVRAAGNNGWLGVDQLELVSTSVAPEPSTSPSSSPTPSPSTTPSGSAPCAVGYVLAGQWQGGFQADVTIRNTGGSPVNGWTLRWDAGYQISQSWNATVTKSGTTVTATNAGHNAGIPAGGTATFGFIGSGTGSQPSAFTLNGAPCVVN